MDTALDNLTAHLLHRVALVQRNLGGDPELAAPETAFADLLDSMGLVEFVALLADDCGVAPARIEAAVGHRFGTVAKLAHGLSAAGIAPHRDACAARHTGPAAAPGPTSAAVCWLGAMTACLPETIQTAAFLDQALGRSAGWLEAHAGIRQRRVWAGQDPLAAAAEAGRQCLQHAGILLDEVGAILVTGEAPPLLAGLGAALHHRLGARPETAVVEVGGACTGFLAALRLAQLFLPRVETVLVLCVEAPSHYLRVGRGPAGEAAALFGDAAAAAVLCAEPPGPEAVALGEVLLGTDGSAGHFLRVSRDEAGAVGVHMEGAALAGRAVRAMAGVMREVLRRHGLAVGDLTGVVAHGGNGRMPGVLARQLGLPADRVWSEAPRAGNLGAASLPVAWAARQPPPGPVVWTAAGAGLTWGGVLSGWHKPDTAGDG
jgi:3-oxoacyl-[acyl-carrier-protein] synthase-3